jgi:hypothetical protein
MHEEGKSGSCGKLRSEELDDKVWEKRRGGNSSEKGIKFLSEN